MFLELVVSTAGSANAVIKADSTAMGEPVADLVQNLLLGFSR